MQITPAVLAAAYQNFNARWNGAFQAQPNWYNELAMIVPSASRDERYSWIESMPGLREWIGERLVHNLAARGHVVSNKDWELTVELDRNDFEDDRLGTFAPTIDLMGVQAKKWPDQVMKRLIQAGATTTGWDGQYFFDTDHPVNYDSSGAGTYANRYTSTALTLANYASVRAAMSSLLSPDGEALGVSPNILAVPPQLLGTANAIINAEFVTASVTNIWRNTATVMEIKEFANEPTVWYLFDTTKPVKPFVWQLRKAPQFDRKDTRTDDEVFWRKKFVYGTDARGNAGYALPFLAARCEA
jgi:phage major head subunit gpT-like protein